MVDPGYSDPRLVALYDDMNAGRWDVDFYAAQAGPAPRRIADVGCGTGSFTVELARAGHRVVGVDPAAEMLRVARTRPGGDLVRWVEGTATDLPDGPFDLAFMTGHAFQCLLTDDDIRETLTAVRSRLAPGGRFWFESRNPVAKAWLGWTTEPGTPDVFETSQGRVEESRVVLPVDGELVTFEDITRFLSDGAEIASTSTLRFAPASRLAELLAETGYDDVRWYGDWEGGAFDEESSREIIVGAA